MKITSKAERNGSGSFPVKRSGVCGVPTLGSTVRELVRSHIYKYLKLIQLT